MFKAFMILVVSAFIGLSPAFAAQDAAQEFPELQKKAAQGDPLAQYSLGKAYLAGQEVDKDFDKALPLLTKAAEQGHAEAQFSLANMYYNGYGVQPDRAEALKWYLKSAEQGHVVAQSNVAYFYRAGWGDKKNFVKAYMWYTIAITGGDVFSADERNRMSVMMTKQQIAEGLDLAKKWKPVKSKVTQRAIESSKKNKDTD